MGIKRRHDRIHTVYIHTPFPKRIVNNRGRLISALYLGPSCIDRHFNLRTSDRLVPPPHPTLWFRISPTISYRTKRKAVILEGSLFCLRKQGRSQSHSRAPLKQAYEPVPSPSRHFCVALSKPIPRSNACFRVCVCVSVDLHSCTCGVRNQNLV